MKKLSEMKIEKDAILSSNECIDLGAAIVGDSTGYNGPDNPSSISTTVDGLPIGSDAYRGRLLSDWWDCGVFNSFNLSGTLVIKA